MTGPGIEPRTPASLVRFSTTELSRPISLVHLARTTISSPLKKSLCSELRHTQQIQIQFHPVWTNQIQLMPIKEGHGTK